VCGVEHLVVFALCYGDLKWKTLRSRCWRRSVVPSVRLGLCLLKALLNCCSFIPLLGTSWVLVYFTSFIKSSFSQVVNIFFSSVKCFCCSFGRLLK